jgi:hypothetical protein
MSRCLQRVVYAKRSLKWAAGSRPSPAGRFAKNRCACVVRDFDPQSDPEPDAGRA